MECMEKNTLPVEQIPLNAAVMIDAMAILQSITSPPTTFLDLAIMIFDKITAQGYKRVDFVTDQYPDLSIKTYERRSRGRQGLLKIKFDDRSQKRFSAMEEVSVVRFQQKKFSNISCLRMERKRVCRTTKTLPAVYSSRHRVQSSDQSRWTSSRSNRCPLSEVLTQRSRHEITIARRPCGKMWVRIHCNRITGHRCRCNCSHY